jgi:hypothetical protein
MKFIICVLLAACVWADQPVFENPGIPAKEKMTAWDYINKKEGFVKADINVVTRTVGKNKYYYIESTEGKYFKNCMTLNYETLAPVEEQRFDNRTGKIMESLKITDNTLRFYNAAKGIDLTVNNPDPNTYSRYSYFFSMRGFPFETAKEVRFMSYMFEYGNALELRATNLGKVKVKSKAGVFECWKLEVAMSGWQAPFAPDKYYLYFTVKQPHCFIKFDQKVEDSQWLSNELMSYNPK